MTWPAEMLGEQYDIHPPWCVRVGCEKRGHQSEIHPVGAIAIQATAPWDHPADVAIVVDGQRLSQAQSLLAGAILTNLGYPAAATLRPVLLAA